MSFTEALKKLFPVSLKYYQNDEEGIEQGEILNRPGSISPTRMRWYDDNKRGIHLLDFGNDDTVGEFLRNDKKQKRKMLE